MVTHLTVDLGGVLTGPPVRWLASGLVATLAVTATASLIAGLVAVGLLGLRIARHPALRLASQGAISVLRNSPLLVQLLFWYFAGFSVLPAGLQRWIAGEHPWASLPPGVPLISPEFLAAAWGLGLFSGAFIAEEIRAGLEAVSPGQRDAARSQGFGHWGALWWVLLPQALRNAFQPVIGQLLNLMKLSSLACSIGLAELTYQVRQIESYNAHALEAFAAGTMLYLVLGVAMERLLLAAGPRHGLAVAEAPGGHR